METYYVVPKGKNKLTAKVKKKGSLITFIGAKNKVDTLGLLQRKIETCFHDKGFLVHAQSKSEGEYQSIEYAMDTDVIHDHTIEEFDMIETSMVGTTFVPFEEYQPPASLAPDNAPVYIDESVLKSKNGKALGDTKNRFKRMHRPKEENYFCSFLPGDPTPIMEVNSTMNDLIIEGDIFSVEMKEFPNVWIVTFNVVDSTNGIKVKVFFKDHDNMATFLDRMKTTKRIKLKGKAVYDNYDRDIQFSPQSMCTVTSGTKRTENRSDSRVELHLHTKMSDKDALVAVPDLMDVIKEWGHPAVAITDHGVLQAFPEAQYLAAEKGVKIIYGVEAYLIDNAESDTRYHIIILAKNTVGLRNLYKLVSLSHLKYFKRRPRIPRSVIEEHREGLIIGSACEAGELIRAIVRGESKERLLDIASFYDYLEIQPIGNNQFLIHSGKVPDEESLYDINRTVVDLGDALQIPVVATCDVHFLTPEDKIYREIMMTASGFKDAHLQPDLYLRTTDEMLEEFAYLGEDKAYEVVVTNSRKINDEIETLKPIPNGTYAPKIEGADKALKEMCIRKAESIYGTPLPDVVNDRLEYEMKSIIGHGFGVLYYIAHKLVKKSLDDGYLVGSRGSVGSSFVATMADITEVNPLPPHYVCPACHYNEFFLNGEYAGGFDLPSKKCPSCGKDLHTDGHDIPFAIFMGFDGDKVPDIDLNFSGDYQPRAHKYTEELFGRDNVFRAGTIGTIAEKTAFGYVKKYAEVKGLNCRNSYYEALATGLLKVKVTTGQHPGGIMVCPRDMDVHHFTPVQYPANKRDSGIITTHFDYHSIEGRMTKLDILGHDDPTIIRMLEDLTGINAQSVPFDDPNTLSLFTSPKALGLEPSDLQGDTVGTLAVPEFGTQFVRKMLEDSKPTTFSELVRISGFSHGTKVWLDNAQELIREGTCKINEAISTRDDIMTYLRDRNVEPIVAFSIMENVRKGKGIESKNKQGEPTTNYVEVLKNHNIPEWFIDSCLKISYLFPKAHAVAYVMMAFRIAWFKINYPQAFYAAYFSIRAKAFDCAIMVPGIDTQLAEYKRLKAQEDSLSPMDENMLATLEVAMEMTARGYSFLPVHIEQSDALQFKIVGDQLLPPFIAVDGLGETLAMQLVEEREKSPFSSIKDVTRRCKMSQTIMDKMIAMGSFGDLQVDEQMNLFA